MFNQNKKINLSNAFKILFISLLANNAVAGESVEYLDQGWTEQQRQTFYQTPQGSYLVPLKWYLSLERRNSTELISSDRNIKKYNYLINTNSNGDSRHVPLGFAIEPVANGDDWLGYSCAACHTNDIKFGGKKIRIDGAPTLANFSRFVSGIRRSVISTLNNADKFNRFAKRVIATYDPTEKEKLFQALTSYAKTLREFGSRNHTDLKYGYGRLDAFGIIMNELFVDDLHVTQNRSEPNAPVSYPFLWGTPSHDWVQWNGGANNPIGRNVGEVLGTFGSINLVDPTKFGTTSARASELIVLENLVKKLKAPKWPEQYLGVIDKEKAEKGRVIYQESHGYEESCASCHALKDANGLYPLTLAEENLFGAQFVVTNMSPLAEIKTDATSALNFATRVVSTGHLAPLLPAPYTGAAELPAPLMLSLLVGMATQSSIAAVEPALTQAQIVDAIGYRIKANGLPAYSPKNLLAYRARPLDGIWATAPYLHNGSVQNLKDLLKPASQRKQTFYVGSHKFDVKRVGFVSENQSNTSLLDTTIPSNSNSGHEYGVNLSAEEKSQLLEFLKTL